MSAPAYETDIPKAVAKMGRAAGRIHEAMLELANADGLVWRDALLQHPVVQAMKPGQMDLVLLKLEKEDIVIRFEHSNERRFRAYWLTHRMMIEFKGEPPPPAVAEYVSRRFNQGYVYRKYGAEEYVRLVEQAFSGTHPMVIDRVEEGTIAPEGATTINGVTQEMVDALNAAEQAAPGSGMALIDEWIKDGKVTVSDGTTSVDAPA